MGWRLYPKDNNKFGEWLKAHRFDNIKKDTRADAMWFASYPAGNTVPAGLTHPKHIRQWFNEQQASKAPPAVDLSSIQPRSRPEMTRGDAKKTNKLNAMGTMGTGQEAETAQKYLIRQTSTAPL